MAAATGNAGLYGGVGPNAYVQNLYAPLRAQLSQQAQANLAAFQSLIRDALNQTQTALQTGGQPYANAITDTNNLARTSGADLAAANPNDQTIGMLKAIGAPQAQQDQVTGQNRTVFGGGGSLLGYLGGVVPSTQMGQDAQARNTYLASLPSMIANTARGGIAQLGSQAQQAQLGLDQQEATARQNAVSTLAAFVQKNQALRQAAAKNQFNQNLATAKYRTGVDEFNARQSLATTRLQWQQANADRAYGLSYAKFVASENKAAAKQRTLTPSQLNTVSNEANKDAFTLYHGIPAVTRADGTVTKPAVPALTYQAAVKRLATSHPALGVSGAVKILNTYYQPGEGGRPQELSSLDGAPTVMGPTAPGAPAVVKAAALSLGTPYVWGGNSPGKALDCSGFIQQTYKHLGINLPRTTYDQVKVGRPVSLNDLQPGDAIFTIPGQRGPEHVGLYIGNGQVQVSPSRGDVNKIVPLRAYLSLGFVAARRYLNG